MDFSLPGLKDLNNSGGKIGGDAGPSSTGALNGGGARTQGITFNESPSVWPWVALMVVAVVGMVVWLKLQ